MRLSTSASSSATRWIAAACLAGAAGAGMAAEPMPVTTLSAGMHLITAEVAATEEQRAQGLMHREKLAPNAGMVFAFGAPARVCMWMKNTPLPLSVAFLDRQGVVLNIADMQPNTTTSHCSRQPAHYALEMEQGWFARKGIKPGSLIKHLP